MSALEELTRAREDWERALNKAKEALEKSLAVGVPMSWNVQRQTINLITKIGELQDGGSMRSTDL